MSDLAHSRYESLLESVGNFGKYHILMFLWFQITCFLCTVNMGFMVFGGIVPSCQQNSSESPNATGTISSSETDCSEYFSSVVMQFSLLNSRKYITSLTTSLQMAGVFLGPLCSGQLSDRFGRKIVFLSFMAMQISAGMVSAFSPNWQMFAVCRFLIGFGLGGTFSVQITWACECFLSKNRMLLYIGGWPLGYVILALLAMITREWRSLSIAGNAVGIPSFVIACFMYESPKWLLERGKIKLATQNLEKIAKYNGSHFDKENFDILSPAPTQLRIQSKTYTFLHLFRNRESTKRILLSMFTYSVAILVYYGLLFNLGSFAGDPAVNTLIMGSLRLTFGIAVPVLDRKISRIGRRCFLQIGIFAWTFCVIGIFGIYALGLEKQHPWFLRANATCALGFSSIYWIVAELISVELFPTVLRNSGNALTSASARIAAIFAPNIMWLADLWYLAPWVLILCFLVLDSLLNFFFLPETKGQPLPDLEHNEQQPNVDV